MTSHQLVGRDDLLIKNLCGGRTTQRLHVFDKTSKFRQLVEILGGLAVTLASLPMAAVLLVAMFTVHLPFGFSSIKLEAVTAAGAQFGPPGYEVDLLYLACLAALVLGGPGPLAIGP
jgi:hypothetical protein